MLKVAKDDTSASSTSSEADDRSMFDIVVCQADKRIVCSAVKNGKSKCKTWKKVVPVAHCEFMPDLWNLGGTCIANTIWNSLHPQCPEKMTVTRDIIKKRCRKPRTKRVTKVDPKTGECETVVDPKTREAKCRKVDVIVPEDVNKCANLASALAEYY